MKAGVLFSLVFDVNLEFESCKMKKVEGLSPSHCFHVRACLQVIAGQL